MSTGSRFVDVPTKDLTNTLVNIGSAISERGGRYVKGQAGREVVYDFFPHRGRAMVRVYTTMAIGASQVRDCGKDAVRVVVGHIVDERFKPLRRHKKMLRTAPKGEESERIAIFLERLTDRLRSAYGEALAIPWCPQCNSVMKMRKGKHGEFWGCTDYPNCRGTRPVTKDRPETEKS